MLRVSRLYRRGFFARKALRRPIWAAGDREKADGASQGDVSDAGTTCRSARFTRPPNRRLAIEGVGRAGPLPSGSSTAPASGADLSPPTLLTHSFHPSGARCAGLDRRAEVLRFANHLFAFEFHDAHDILGLLIVSDDDFADPKTAAAQQASDGEAFPIRLSHARFLDPRRP